MSRTMARPKLLRGGALKNAPVRMIPRSRMAAAVERMAASKGADRFAALKALSVTAEKDPGRVYPYFDAIAAQLNSDSKIVCWNAMQILARLAPVDGARRLDSILDVYLGFIEADNMVSAANAIQGAGRMAATRPELLDRVIPAILGVERANYRTQECRNVVIGVALETCEQLGECVCGRPDVAEFIRRQRANPRASVARRAQRMAAC